MPLFSPIISSLNAGEFSPLLGGRVDFEKYPKALKLCENFIPLVQGPIMRRPGTMYAAEVKDSSKRSALVRFEFSTTQAYILEFGDLYMRVFKDEAQVTATAQNITGITQANPGVVTYSGSDTYANGDPVFISGVVGMTQVNGRRFTVANVNTGANTFELSSIDTSAYTAYSSGGTVAEIYEIATTYTQADLFDSKGALRLKFAQSADVLYIAHPSYAPRKLTRTGHASWTLTTISFIDGPYLNTNATSTTLTLGATSGSGVSLTASASLFAATDVGRPVRIKHSNLWGWGTISAYTSATVVSIDIVRTFGAATGTVDWRLGVWSGTTGYPACVGFYGDRLYWMGPSSLPQRGDGSNVGDYENMAPTSFAAGSTTDNTVIADDDAVAFSLGGDEVNAIKSIAGGEQGISILTVGGEWIARPSNQNEAITPTNIRATQSTNWGTSEVAPIRAGKANIFIQRDRRTLREVAYVFAEDGFKTPDISIAAEHLPRPGVCAMAFQKSPQTILWLVREDGKLLSVTYDREQEAIAWARHTLGGEFSSGEAVVESCAVIPNTDGTSDQLWLIVKRTINGGTKRYVEYLTPMWDDSIDKSEAYFVDCGLQYSGSAASSFTGLWHLEGEDVDILAGGAVKPQDTVASGTVELATGTATKASIGLHYDSNAWTERLELRSGSGSIQGKAKRITKLMIRFWQTLGGKYGPDADNLTTIVFRSASDPMNASSPLKDEDITLDFDAPYDSDGRIYIRQDQPLPMTVLAVVPELWTDI
jgi:hypothetical protein